MQEQIDALWAAVNQLRASLEDGISAQQVVDVIDQKIANIKVMTRGDIDGVMSGNLLLLSTPPKFETSPIVEPTEESTHPWKVTETGTSFLTVAPGSILFPQGGTATPPDFSPFVYLPASYAGGTVEVTAAEGYLYALADGEEDARAGEGEVVVSPNPTVELTLVVRRPQTLSVVFSTEYPITPSAKLAYMIAEVAMADGVATVVKQHLTHNPTHDLVYLQVASDI